MILYLWAVVHFSNVLHTSNFATHKWASPNANIWFSVVIKGIVTFSGKPSFCLHQLLMKWMPSKAFVSWKMFYLTTCVCELFIFTFLIQPQLFKVYFNHLFIDCSHIWVFFFLQLLLWFQLQHFIFQSERACR